MSSLAGEDSMSTKEKIQRATSTVRHAFEKLTHRNHEEHEQDDDSPILMQGSQQSIPRAIVEPETRARPRRVEADIPLDEIEGSYSPTQTSLKASFRTDGSDHQRDQEYSGGYADERWNDEDRFTNKSGDPRIGTHGRSYEPGEGGKRR